MCTGSPPHAVSLRWCLEKSGLTSKTRPSKVRVAYGEVLLHPRGLDILTALMLAGAACVPGQQGDISAGDAVSRAGAGPPGSQPCVQHGPARGQRRVPAPRGSRRPHRQPCQG